MWFFEATVFLRVSTSPATAIDAADRSRPTPTRWSGRMPVGMPESIKGETD